MELTHNHSLNVTPFKKNGEKMKNCLLEYPLTEIGVIIAQGVFNLILSFFLCLLDFQETQT